VGACVEVSAALLTSLHDPSTLIEPADSVTSMDATVSFILSSSDLAVNPELISTRRTGVPSGTREGLYRRARLQHRQCRYLLHEADGGACQAVLPGCAVYARDGRSKGGFDQYQKGEGGFGVRAEVQLAGRGGETAKGR
jgi:hypothetical protein